jgi:RNA polymerase sigma-70 factor, ECF subfamily
MDKKPPMSIWPENEQTQQLLELAKRGDRDATDRLLSRHREALRRMISLRLDRRIQQRVDASDIVQDVLVDADRRLATYLQDPSIPFHLWLRQMAKDRLIDAHRRHHGSAKRSVSREQPMVALGGMDESTLHFVGEISDPELTPAAAATMQELQVRFEGAIGQLPEQDQEIILMRHFEHLSNQDIAQSLGLTEPAASMRYLRAIRRLRLQLGMKEGGDVDASDG